MVQNVCLALRGAGGVGDQGWGEQRGGVVGVGWGGFCVMDEWVLGGWDGETGESLFLRGRCTGVICG